MTFHREALKFLAEARPDLAKVLDTPKGRRWLDGQGRSFGRLRRRVVTVEVFGGLVSDVKGLPKGWTYKVHDLDAEKVS